MVVMGTAARSAGLVFASALLLLVSACTSGDTVNTSTVPVTDAPPTTSAARTSASPTPTPRPYPADVPLTGHNVKPGEKPPLYPAAARAHTQAGANAFAEFYMRTLDWAYATTNPSYMEHYTEESCGQCRGLAQGIHRTAADRHWYLGGRLTIQKTSGTAIRPVTAPADYCSLVKIDITATSVVDKTGKVFNGDSAYAGDLFKLCAKGTSSDWRITYMSRTA